MMLCVFLIHEIPATIEEQNRKEQHNSHYLFSVALTSGFCLSLKPAHMYINIPHKAICTLIGSPAGLGEGLCTSWHCYSAVTSVLATCSDKHMALCAIVSAAGCCYITMETLNCMIRVIGVDLYFFSTYLFGEIISLSQPCILFHLPHNHSNWCKY